MRCSDAAPDNAMNPIIPLPLRPFAPALWRTSLAGSRSASCTPLYVAHSVGPRHPVPGRLLSAHGWWELTAVLQGSVRIVTPQSPVEVSQGELILLGPRLRHAEVGETSATIWIGLAGRQVAGAAARLSPTTKIRSSALVDSVERLWLFARQQGGPIGPELDAWTAHVMASFFRLALEPAAAAAATSWIEAAVTWIEGHMDESIRIADLARRAGCSEGHFCRAFRARTGFPPVVYILRTRMQRALHLLHQTNWTVAEVARAVGIENAFYFSRAFRRIHGQSPSESRTGGRAH
jgi:AraC-like DNA-binding protein